MRMLRAIGAPLAVFGYLLHLLLPVTTALAYDAGARSDILEICTVAGVKRTPLSVMEAQGWPLAPEGGQEQDAAQGAGAPDDGRPAQHPTYCPGSAPAVDIPLLVLLDRPVDCGFAQIALFPDQPILAGADPAAGPSPRGPPLPV